jgi:hypothetical protein
MKQMLRMMFIALSVLLAYTASGIAQPLAVDFKQASNNNRQTGQGNVYWINSVLQGMNSIYYEGMSVPQRILLVNIRATNGNAHTLTFNNKASHNGKHAYDFLTSYDQAVAAASVIGGPNVLVNLNNCGSMFNGPNSIQTTCQNLHSGRFSFVVDAPDNMGTVLNRSVATRVANYESRFGNRTIKIYGNSPITSASLVFSGYQNHGGGVRANYTLHWTSASTSILVEFATHLALGNDAHNAGTGIGYGNGLGAGSINGAPYHVSLGSLDGSSLGNRDNPIMAGAVRKSLPCDVSGPDPVCTGSQNVYTYTHMQNGLTFSWALSNNTSGASIVGSTTGRSVQVQAGNTEGGYTLTVSVSDGTQTKQCPVNVGVHGLMAAANGDPILCHGATAEVNVVASGGRPPYQGTGRFNRGAGKHTFTVTDANGCEATTSVTLVEPPPCAITVNATPILCTGGTSTVTVSATGGTPPYTGTGTFVRSAGTYTFTIADANNCVESATIIISEPAPLSAAVTATDILCYGEMSNVTVAANGGTPPYTGTGVFQRAAGQYTFTVTDANGCTAASSITLTEPSELRAVVTATPINCNGDTSTVTVTASGGTAPYSGTGVFYRTAGTWPFTVTDANGCTTVVSITISGSGQLDVTASATPILCHGGLSAVTVAATGGTAPYSGTGVFNRAGGSWSFTVTDANGCSGTASVTVTEPPLLSASATATTILCGGDSATVTVTAQGGTPPYIGTGVFKRIAGTYVFTVTDANGCTDTAAVTVTAAQQIAVTAVATPILCNGDSSTVTVSATGGTPPYTGVGVFMRPAGSYTFTVSDANACSGSASISITEPTPLQIAAVASQLNCHGDTATVTVTASGGTAPYTGTGVFYRTAGTWAFTVTDANGCIATDTVIISGGSQLIVTASAMPILCHGGLSAVTVAATGGTAPYSGTGVFNRAGGSWSFTVTDANGCSGTASVTVTEPPLLSASATATTILCGGDSATVTVTAQGGTPPYIGTGVFKRIAGTYVFTVTDANGCSDTAAVTVTAAQQIAVTAVATSILCNGDSSTVTVSATGGTPPYTGVGAFMRPAGSYTFTVSDANACSGSASISITEPTPLQIAAVASQLNCHGDTATVTVTASGGTAPYTGTGVFYRTAGTWAFTVTDANGCIATDTVIISGGSQLIVTASATPILCYGGTSSVTVAATGGTGPYTGTGQFTRGAGTFTFTVTDANNCSAIASVTITEPPQLSVTASALNLNCVGDTSIVTVSASGGVQPYVGTGNFPRTAGNYTFTVTDANGCTALASVTITQPQQLVAAVSATPILCAGDSSTIHVTATGGTLPYSGTGIFSRPAGSYEFIVTDANGCADTVAVTMTAPPVMTLTSTATPILCNGGVSAVTISASGGTPPYTGVGNFSRPAGTHVLTVTDANGCMDTTVVTITEPPALVATATGTPILCFGATTTITVAASGGTPPYSGTGAYVRDAGTYSFTVTDANNCSAVVTLTVPEPPLLSASSFASQINCAGGNSTVTVTASGGTLPYTGTGSFTRGAGTWTFIVTDAHGCTTSTTVTITAPPQLTATTSATAILCHGGTSTVTVAASGGTPPYTGTGSYVRGAGTFTFTVTDANNCSVVASVSIPEPPLLTVNASALPILCDGDTSVVTVTASGGVPPYSGAGNFMRTAGNYSFTVTDANGCTAHATVTITQPDELIASVAATPIMCYGDSSIVHVTAVGGTLPHSGTGVFSRPAGSYDFIVTDAHGCSDTVSITITEPTQIQMTSSSTPILCFGGTSTVTIAATGGTPPYTGVGNFSRQAGTHIFRVSDSNGCEDSVTVFLTEPPELLPTAYGTPILCFGGTTTITVAATGGTPPYTGTGSFVRDAGTYSFTVTDANGCTAIASVTVPEPPLLTAQSFATAILCYGDSSIVTVTAYGGTLPYTGVGTFTRSPGTHTFTVTDANGCTATTTVTITGPPQLTAASSATPLLCYGDNSTVTVTAAGGTPPYTGTGVFSRPAGTHIFTVRDANNCTVTTTITITEPPQLFVVLNATPILCTGDSTTISITATGGTPPYSGVGTVRRVAGNHTFTVTDANNCTASAGIRIDQPPLLSASASATPILCFGDTSIVHVTATGGTPPYAGTGVFGKRAGTYLFIVTDDNGCSDTATVTITEPPVLNVMSSATAILCHGGLSTVTITATGGTPPYTGVGNFSRPAGTHVFRVVDANGCEDSTTVTLTEPPPIVPNATATPILCYGDYTTITVTATGGTPPYTGTGTYGRPAGTYTFTVTDANNCTAQVTIVVPQPPQLHASAFATPILCYGDSSVVTITAYGGTQPYAGTGVFTRGPGTYTFTVTDANGCKATTTITITEPPQLFATATALPLLCHGGTTEVTVSATGGTPPYQGVGVFYRGAGIHTFTVTDSNGCTVNATVNIAEPPKLVAAATATTVYCGKDPSIVTITASGGTQPYNGTGTFSRMPGFHTFIVTDANGCADTISINITGPPPLVAAATATPIRCNGGNTFITVSASGGTPPYTGTGLFIRTAGTHTFIVRDAFNCADTVQVTVSEPPPLTVICIADPHCINGWRHVHAIPSGGTPPYSFHWSPGNMTTQSIQVPCHDTGTYTVTVRDANWDPNDPNNGACQASCSITLQFIKPGYPGDDKIADDGELDPRHHGRQKDNEADNSGSIDPAQKHAFDGKVNDYALFENYPNPFNPSTTIRYYLPEESYVHLSIVSTLGKTIAVLVNEPVSAGMHHAIWDATSLYGEQITSGSYFYRIHAKSLLSNREFVRERLMLLLR